MYKCQNCKEEVTLQHFAHSRHDIESDLGTYFDVKCAKCLSTKKYHTNDIYAVAKTDTNLLIIAFCIVVFLSGAMFLWNLGYIATFTFGIPLFGWIIYKQSVESKITTFNRSNVSRENNYKPKKAKKLY